MSARKTPSVRSAKPEVSIRDVAARAFTIPTDTREADGTLSWAATSVVLA
jgi:hypothetical protein